MKRKIWIFQLILLTLLLVSAAGCRNSRDSAREYERMERKMLKENEKKLESVRKNHLKIQSKATRQMMKDSKKRAKQLNKPKRR